MKHKIRKNLKNGFLILGVLILLFSCQKEDIETQETIEQSKEVVYGNITFNEFSNRFDLGAIDQNVTSKFNYNLFFQESMINNVSFSTDETDKNYTIDTGIVKTAAFDEKTTFSMKVIRDSPKPNTITNIFFELSPSGEKAYLLEFKRDEQTGRYESVTKFDTDYNELYSASIVANYDASIIFVDIYYFDCAAGHDSSCSSEGCCDNCYSSQQFIVWNDGLGSGTSGDYESNSPVGEGSGGTNTDSGSIGNIFDDHPYFSSGSSTAIGIVDNNTTINEDIYNAQEFFASLNTDQRVWANSNQFEYLNLVNYLLVDYTEPLQELMRKVITFRKINPSFTIGFDNSLTENQTIEFNTFDDFETNIKRRPSTNVENIATSNETTEKKQFDFNYQMTPFSNTIRVVVDYVKPEYNSCDCIEVTDVTTVHFGNTTFLKWEQFGDFWTEMSNDGENIIIFVQGKLTTGVNIDGFPFKITNLVTYVITLEYSTGYVIDITTITE